jgi:hypothetical protein
VELLQTVIECVCKTVENLKNLDIDPGDIKAIGVCNQRETTIVWDKLTGKPLYNPSVSYVYFLKMIFLQNKFCCLFARSLAGCTHEKYSASDVGESARRK